MDQSLNKRDAASSRCVQRKQLIHLDQWNEDLYQPAQHELGCRVYVNAKALAFSNLHWQTQIKIMFNSMRWERSSQRISSNWNVSFLNARCGTIWNTTNKSSSCTQHRFKLTNASQRVSHIILHYAIRVGAPFVFDSPSSYLYDRFILFAWVLDINVKAFGTRQQ